MKVRNYAPFVLLLFLAGCSSWGFFTADKPLSQRIDDARLLASAYADEIAFSRDSDPPLMTKKQAQAELDEIVKVRKALNDADAFIGVGDLASAEARYKLASTALQAVRAEIAKRKGVSQ